MFRDESQWIQCTSERVRAQLEHRYGVARQRSVLVRNGVDLEHFHPEARTGRFRKLRSELAAGSSCVWLFAGSGFARKGLDTALRALKRGGPRDAVLWVAGADPQGPWRARAEALGLGERVRFLGYRRDMAALYAAADALLLPTRYDAFANACLEAAASGGELPGIGGGRKH